MAQKIKDARLTELFKRFGLVMPDYYFDDEYVRITKTGIAKIRNKMDAEVFFDIRYQKEDWVSLIATAKIGGGTFQSTGEASPANNSFPYPVAVAEARGESRVILKAAGLYEENFRGEEELTLKPEKPDKKGLTKDGVEVVKSVTTEIDRLDKLKADKIERDKKDKKKQGGGNSVET